MRISDWSSDVCSSDLAAAHGLAGFLHQLDHFLERQRRRFAVLGDAAVELAVADVRAVAAVEDLDVAAVELLDAAVAGDLLLFLDQEYRVREVVGVRVVFLLQRTIYTDPFGKCPETADANDRHRSAAVRGRV